MTNAIFRDTTVAVEQELGRQCEARLASARELRKLRPLFARRVGRVAAGATMLAIAVPLLALAGARELLSWLPTHVLGPLGPCTCALLGAWPVAIVAGALGRVLGARRFDAHDDSRSSLARLRARLGRDPLLALARLRATPTPDASLGARVRRLEVASLALPMMGCALLAPLTLHAFAVMLVGEVAPGIGGLYTPESRLRDFDSWMSVSVILVGHAHLVLAGHAWRYARRLGRQPLGDVTTGDGWRALFWAVFASAVPGGVLLLVPPAIAFATGGAFIPLMYRRARATWQRERAVVEALAALSPAATRAVGPREHANECEARSDPRLAPRS